jgi:Mitochondrial carrier protein
MPPTETRTATNASFPPGICGATPHKPANVSSSYTATSSSASAAARPPYVVFATSSAPIPPYVVFATSGLGGCVGWAIVHPFNTIAVRANLASASGKTFSLSAMLKDQGFWSLYDGLSAGVARQVVYATSRLGLFELARDLLHEVRGHTDFISRCVFG